MKKRIFYSTFFASLTVCLASLAVILGVLYNYYSRLYDEQIRQTARYISSGVEHGEMNYLSSVDFSDSGRVTWISKDGTVLFDSIKSAESMKSHADREEVKEAIASGVGEATRYSDTLYEKTFYYAVRLSDNSVLRVSGTQYTVYSLLLSLLWPIVAVIALSVALSYILATLFAKKIVRPINELDFENPEPIKGYHELDPLVDRLIMQNDQISHQLEELSKEHEAQDRMRREFTANVSHELKTPLTSISGFAEIIRDGLVRQEDIQRFAGNIYDEAGRLITLVGDIIKISRLDEQEGQITKDPVDLYDTCMAVATHLQPVADKRGIALNFDGKHISILGSEQIVYEMIFNICDNAIKYNNDNGSVDILLQDDEDTVSVTVSDTGIGIPKEELDRVLERFYRVNKSHSKEIGGTGLGLSIVKHGALSLDAKIEISSELGVGTSITIIFKKS